MNEIQTYSDGGAGVNFTPHLKPQLLFKAWLNHGPGHDEDLAFYVGPNSLNTHDVLWIVSDYDDEISPVAWLTSGILSGSDLNETLLTTFWQRDKEENESEEPNFTEVIETIDAAFSPKQVNELVKRVWPNC